jgi:hypothetical protein
MFDRCIVNLRVLILPLSNMNPPYPRSQLAVPVPAESGNVLGSSRFISSRWVMPIVVESRVEGCHHSKKRFANSSQLLTSLVH